MPTLEQWGQALAAPRRVQVESSPSLLQEVRQRHVKKDTVRQQRGQPIPDRKNITEVSEFAPIRELQVVPLYLLHRLGMVTTPAIENLADICSTWAYFRYLWAFDIPSLGTDIPVLRLSEDARNIDFHQKGLLSDHIGVGMAALLLGDYLGAPLAADVSVAMKGSDWPIDQNYDTSPDYLFHDATSSTLFIVECKGTQKTRSTSVDQLCRGTEQVPSVRFTDGRTPPSLVIATYLSRTGTGILIIDPPGNEDVPVEHPERPERVGQREWRVRNDKEFNRATRLISEAKLLSFAGAHEAAAKKFERTHLQIPKTPKFTSHEPEITENEFGTFLGIRQRVGLKERFNIDVFQALEASVYKAALSEEPDRLAEELRAFKANSTDILTTLGQSQSVLTKHEKGNLIVRSAGPDGSLLEVKVSPP